MNKQDYSDELDRLNEIMMKTQLEKDLLVREFKLECAHEQQYLTKSYNYEEDEYGRSQPSWTTYNYKCNCCNSEVFKSKVEFSTIEEIQAAITAEIKKEYIL